MRRMLTIVGAVLLMAVPILMLAVGCSTLTPETPSDGRVYQFAFVLQDGKALKGNSAVMPDGSILPLIWQDAAGDVSSSGGAKGGSKVDSKAAVGAAPGSSASVGGDTEVAPEVAPDGDPEDAPEIADEPEGDPPTD